MNKTKSNSQNEEKQKKITSLTCIYILTDIDAAGGLTNSTPCYMKNSIKNIWMTIVHSHSTKKERFHVLTTHNFS